MQNMLSSYFKAWHITSFGSVVVVMDGTLVATRMQRRLYFAWRNECSDATVVVFCLEKRTIRYVGKHFSEDSDDVDYCIFRFDLHKFMDIEVVLC